MMSPSVALFVVCLTSGLASAEPFPFGCWSPTAPVITRKQCDVVRASSLNDLVPSLQIRKAAQDCACALVSPQSSLNPLYESCMNPHLEQLSKSIPRGLVAAEKKLGLFDFSLSTKNLYQKLYLMSLVPFAEIKSLAEVSIRNDFLSFYRSPATREKEIDPQTIVNACKKLDEKIKPTLDILRKISAMSEADPETRFIVLIHRNPKLLQVAILSKACSTLDLVDHK